MIKLLEVIKIGGIAIQTTNRKNQSASDIGLLWDRYFEEGVSGKFSPVSTENIYVVYYNYESDHNGDFFVLIGHPIIETEKKKESKNLSTVFLKQQKYLKYPLEGKIPDIIVSAWQNIWKSDFNRSYKTDFEVYNSASLGSSMVKAEINIGID